MNILITYIITLATFAGIDFIWLKTNFPHYQKTIGHLLSEKPNYLAAILFYIFYTAGLVIFSISPALQQNSARNAVIMGGLFGFFTYLTYDLTNWATLKNWPVSTTVIDILWGTFIGGFVSFIVFKIISLF